MIDYSPRAVLSSVHPGGLLARGICRDVTRSCVNLEIIIGADPTAIIRCGCAAVKIPLDIVSLMFQH
jgi:hypothetical protein